MAVYLGYYRPTPTFAAETQARGRERAGPDPTFRKMVQELPEKLPAGCRLLGSYAPLGGGGAVLSEPGPPAVMILETDSVSDLGFITQYYEGYLLFHWLPAVRIGASRDERLAWALASREEFFSPAPTAT